MTDDEIKKALECCKYEYDTKCELCSYNVYSRTGCRSELRRNALDLINRQKADNERLKKLLEEEEAKYKECAKRFYKEAIKEFAVRLKEQKYQSSDWSHGEHPFVVEESDIDDVLYGMVGDTE